MEYSCGGLFNPITPTPTTAANEGDSLTVAAIYASHVFTKPEVMSTTLVKRSEPQLLEEFVRPAPCELPFSVYPRHEFILTSHLDRRSTHLD
jgi:hypothetical protein